MLVFFLGRRGPSTPHSLATIECSFAAASPGHHSELENSAYTSCTGRVHLPRVSRTGCQGDSARQEINGANFESVPAAGAVAFGRRQCGQRERSKRISVEVGLGGEEDVLAAGEAPVARDR